MKKITKAIIAAAGYGTRFLPATKVQPKEMLPIVNKPIIQYLVEELVDSGISEIILVTRVGQNTMENHFDSNFELEYRLERDKKLERLEAVRRIATMANFVYVRQGRHLPYGNAVPLLCARNLIDKNEPFIYLFGDDLVKSQTPCTAQLIDFWQKHRCPDAVIAAQKVAKKEVDRYGILKLKSGSEYEVEDAIEKPTPEEAPSQLAQFGRFILNDKIIKILLDLQLGKDNELWLMDALRQLAKTDRVLAAPIKGKWLTTGDPLRYMQAQVEFALDRKDIGQDFKRFLKDLKL